MQRKPWIAALLAILLFASADTHGQSLQTAADAAAPVKGFPAWEERVLHEWINRARVDPAAELARCGSNCSVAELQPGCYTPMAPLMWRYELNVAARFHTMSMIADNYLSHNTPCTLRSDLASVYPAWCTGYGWADCACSSSGSTSSTARTALFGATSTGEMISGGYYLDLNYTFYSWLFEPVTSSAGCVSYNDGNTTNGDRWLILKSLDSVGAGVFPGSSTPSYTVDFGSGGAVSEIPSGTHYPRQAATIEFWANWYSERAAASARVVVDDTSWYPMTLSRGVTTNGAWSASATGYGSGCHRYYFEFNDVSGKLVRHPANGTFGIGQPRTCADWQDVVTGPPPTLTAKTTSPTGIDVSWTSTGAEQYEVQRSVGGGPFQTMALVLPGGLGDLTVSPGQVYLYRVRAVGGTTWSNVDYASTMAFTDDPVVTRTTAVKSLHIVELRDTANAVRTAVGMPAKTWMHAVLTPGSSVVSAVDLAEIRTAMNEARAQIGASALSFTDATLDSTVPVRAVHIQELRAAMR